MKEWWINLSLREKQTVSIGGFFVILFLIYLVLWSPLNNKVESLRTKIQRDQKLLVWMQDTNRRVQQIEKNQQTKKIAATDVSLLTIVQRQLNKTPLVSSLEQLRQADNDSVQLSFKNVDFDKLAAWLIQLWQQEGLVVSQINVTPSGSPGMVGAELVLKRA